MTARYIIADVFDGLASLPDDSVDLVFSSPPFLALRSYLPADHPDKGKEIGSEATPADFLDTLLDVVEACDRVLAPHGTLAFELGDTYSGSGGGGGDYLPGGMREGHPGFGGSAARERHHPECDLDADCSCPYLIQRDGNAEHWRRKNERVAEWPDAKSLCGIPTLFAWSLAYGRNLLRPERETPRWRIRNLVVWARPNPPVGALGDKFRPATSYLTVATKSRTRYFDLDAVRTEHAEHTVKYDGGTRPHNGERGGQGTRKEYAEGLKSNPAGAPPLDYWVIPTQPYSGSHYATFPKSLVEKPVKAMCPLRVCRVCGEPSRRIVESATWPESGFKSARQEMEHESDSHVNDGGKNRDRNVVTVDRTTLGWTDCAHDSWRTGVVLDPFAGSGTTLAVATGHGRDAIGIDLDERNADLALDRVGPLLLSVEFLSGRGAA